MLRLATSDTCTELRSAFLSLMCFYCLILSGYANAATGDPQLQQSYELKPADTLECRAPLQTNKPIYLYHSPVTLFRILADVGETRQRDLYIEFELSQAQRASGKQVGEDDRETFPRLCTTDADGTIICEGYGLQIPGKGKGKPRFTYRGRIFTCEIN